MNVDDHIYVVEGLLKQLASDDDFHEDLRSPIIRDKMLPHWLNKKRLPLEEADRLGRKPTVIKVFEKLSLLKRACEKAQIQVPFIELIERKTQLSKNANQSQSESTSESPSESQLKDNSEHDLSTLNKVIVWIRDATKLTTWNVITFWTLQCLFIGIYILMQFSEKSVDYNDEI